MWCNQIFSLIDENKVKNIIVADNYEVANQLARNLFGNNALAVDTTLYPVYIGDDYINGKFYRDGEEIFPNPTEHQEIVELQQSSLESEEALCDLDGSIESRLADIEEALCELAEMLS